MNSTGMRWEGSDVIVGEMLDDAICVRTANGRVLRLGKDALPTQRANFFERVFAELSGRESGDAAGLSLRYADELLP
jgi:hypothetical protein